jgi:hypothetical protein
MPDIFFKLPPSKAKKVIQEAIDISTSLIVEELDCRKSICRQKTKKTTDEVFQMGLDHSDTLWHFCIRRWECKNNLTFTDIGLSTGPSTGITYFLWINVDAGKAYDLARKYKLKLI